MYVQRSHRVNHSPCRSVGSLRYIPRDLNLFQRMDMNVRFVLKRVPICFKVWVLLICTELNDLKSSAWVHQLEGRLRMMYLARRCASSHLNWFARKLRLRSQGTNVLLQVWDRLHRTNLCTIRRRRHYGSFWGPILSSVFDCVAMFRVGEKFHLLHGHRLKSSDYIDLRHDRSLNLLTPGSSKLLQST